jgi:exonuclease SbcD
MSVRILHFADAHIDMANYGRRDPESGLPQRVVDFLRSLDQVVDAAIREQVDLVIFAGDAYKDRNPQPTFQREWGKRMMRLSEAGIPTLLLVGNHDDAPAEYRAHTLQEFKTLQVPHIFVGDELRLWKPDELGLPLQIITVPWLTRSKLMARQETTGITLEELQQTIEERLTLALGRAMDEADPATPLVLAAHASVAGAVFGSERQVMLGGQEIVLPTSLVQDPRLDYVALGHIHRHQVLCHRPLVVYPGSIERIDFGEADEKKGYVIATVSRGKAEYVFHPLLTRPFQTWTVRAQDPETFMDDILGQLPLPERLDGMVCRLELVYDAAHEAYLDDARLRQHFAQAFDLRVVRQRSTATRVLLPAGTGIESLTPEELLDHYLRSKSFEPGEMAQLKTLAAGIFSSVYGSDGVTD